MMSELVVPIATDYGGSELKKNYQKYFSEGLIVAVVFHLFIVGAYWASGYFQTEAPSREVILVPYLDFGPPPSISGSTAVAPAVAVAGPVTKPSVEIPVPIPDAEASPEQTIATQKELSAVQSLIGEDVGDGTVVEVSAPIIEIDDTPPPAWVPFEKLPVIIKRVAPMYPELARLANLEGKVIAQLWIDRKGRARDVKIIKSTSEVFNQSVIDAAKQWQYTPALMNCGPVAVWLAVPFNFTLR